MRQIIPLLLVFFLFQACERKKQPYPLASNSKDSVQKVPDNPIQEQELSKLLVGVYNNCRVLYDNSTHDGEVANDLSSRLRYLIVINEDSSFLFQTKYSYSHSFECWRWWTEGSNVLIQQDLDTLQFEFRTNPIRLVNEKMIIYLDSEQEEIKRYEI